MSTMRAAVLAAVVVALALPVAQAATTQGTLRVSVTVVEPPKRDPKKRALVTRETAVTADAPVAIVDDARNGTRTIVY